MPRKIKIDGFIADRAFNRPLLLELGKAQTISKVLEQRMFGTIPVGMYDDWDDEPSDNKPMTPVIDGVAIIPVIGTLVHRGAWIGAHSGMTSYQGLREQLIEAANDGSIRTILLDIDSGGGEVEGNFELCRLIRKINDEYKPVVAISNGSAYSGAFSIGVAAGSFFMTETGGVGSVGVIIQHVDYSKANEARGIKVTQITAGERKGEFSQDFPLSKEAKEMLQKEVDRVADIFVAHVAEMRNISENVVRSTEASLLFGEDAVKIGFVDGMLSYDALLEGLTQTDLPQDPTEHKQRMSEMFLKKKTEADKPADETLTPATAKADDKPEAAEDEESEGDDEEPVDKEAATDEDADKEETEAEKSAKIVEVCAAAGKAEMAAGFIRKGASVQEVKEQMDIQSQIRKACTLAGKPDKAEGFISSGKSLKQVQDTLISEMSDSQIDISAKEDPKAVDADMTATKNVILADVEKRKQALNKGVK